jgi:hypothetical protein
MKKDAVVYCSGAFSSGSPLSLAMADPSGHWYYAEVIDLDMSACDEFTVKNILPRMTKIPGAHFVKGDDLAASLATFLSTLEMGDSLTVKTSPALDPALANVIRQAVEIANVAVPFKLVPVRQDYEMFERFQQHCGGPEKVRHHSLINVLGGILCDTSRNVPSTLSERPITHLELLMGSKNAMSYRAWTRASESAWRAAHPADASADSLQPAI